MIKIVCSNGDNATAPDAEGALLAGRTLYDEALALARLQRCGTLPQIRFYDHEGVLIRSTTDRTELEAS